MRLVCIALVLAVVAAGCSDSDDDAAPSSTAAPGVTTEATPGTNDTVSGESEGDGETPVDPDAPSIADASVRNGVERLIVTGLPAGTEVTAAPDGGDSVGGTTDGNGALVLRDLEPGDYTVAVVGSADTTSATAMSRENSLPPQAFYDGQVLEEGYQYIEMRDGTLLAANVFLPPGDGPYVTVIEYSGYSPAKPGGNFLEAVAGLGIDDPSVLCLSTPIVCNAPDQSGSIFAYANDFAVVAVNMRGTGCSGGSFGYFDVAQRLDGYDIVEAVAAQDWVKNNQVGMVGLSYPGISQLFVAAEQPPGLAAIAPFSVFDDVARDVVAPGGVFNQGFAGAYSASIDSATAPYGQGWEQERVDGGDTVCEQNQLLRGQNANLVESARASRYLEPELTDPLHVETFADRIEVPVLLAGAWQDAQISSGGLDLADEFVNSPFTKVIVSNGSHADPWALETLVVWKDFLDIYVGGEQRGVPPLIGGFFPTLLDDALFKTVAPLPERPLIEGTPEEQRQAFEAEPRVLYHFERGGNADNPGAPVARYTHGANEWLSANDETTTLFLGVDGALSTNEPTASDAGTSFNLDPNLADLTTLPGNTNPTTSVPFEALPPYEWLPEPDGSAAIFVSEPLADDFVWLGDAAANLWVRSDAELADLSVTVSEVRPDGSEMYIQSGFLRTELRTPGPDATTTDPDLRGMEADAAPLPVGEWVEASIPLPLTGHIFRAGSSVRVSFHSPGGDRPTWTFEIDPVPDGAAVEIGHSAEYPSSITMATDSTVTGYPADVPVCPGTRGQPCRA
jgi:predicted acyl esterase